MTDRDRIADLEARLAAACEVSTRSMLKLREYEEACAVMYQFAGCFMPHVPVEVLDNLSALQSGRPLPHKWPMPVGVETVDRVKRQGATEELKTIANSSIPVGDLSTPEARRVMDGWCAFISERFQLKKAEERAAELEREA